MPAGGFRQLMEAFDLERCGNTTMSLACGQSAFDYVLDYVQEREQFGKPIIEFQAVQLQLAQMKMGRCAPIPALTSCYVILII